MICEKTGKKLILFNGCFLCTHFLKIKDGILYCNYNLKDKPIKSMRYCSDCRKFFFDKRLNYCSKCRKILKVI